MTCCVSVSTEDCQIGTFTFDSSSNAEAPPVHRKLIQVNPNEVKEREISLDVSFKDGRICAIKKWFWEWVAKLKPLTLLVLQILVTNVVLRGISGFFIIFLIFFMILFHQSEIPIQVTLPVCSAIAIAGAIFFTVSNTFRCVTILSLPNFGTQQGRLVLMAINTSLLLGGPLTSLNTNIYQLGESVQCLSLNTPNQAKEILKNYAESYNDIYNYLDYHVASLRAAKTYVDQELRPLKESLADIRRHLGNFEHLLKITGTDCLRTVEQARVDCVQGVINAFNRCKKKSFLESLNVDDVCEVVWIITDICQPILNHVILCGPVRLSRTLAAEVNAGFKNLENAFRIDLTVIKNFSQTLNHTVRTPELQEIQSSMTNIVEKLILVFTICKYLFLSAIFSIPVKSYFFLRHVRKGLTTSPTAFLQRFPEYNRRMRRSELWSQGLVILGHFLFTLTIFGVDYASYWILNVFRTIGDVGNVTIENTHTFQLNLTVGKALMLNPLATFQNDYLKKLNMATNRNYSFSSAATKCLPKVVKSCEISFLVTILFVYVLVVLLIKNGNRLLKYRLEIIYFVIPDMKQSQEDPTLRPYSIPEKKRYPATLAQ